MEFTIRNIRKEEYPVLNDFLYEAIFKREGEAEIPYDIIYKPELKVYTEGFGRKDDHCLVAEVEGKVIGAVWVRCIIGYGHLEDAVPEFAISLFKEYRGKGIGTAMMRTMLRLLKEKRYAKTSLAVQKDNYALKMYQKVGFQIVGETSSEYLMCCELDRLSE